MPLQPYKRGQTWWAKGRIEYNGRAITEYLRESTGASSEAGARDWIREREDREIRRYIVGEEHVFTFADAVVLSNPDKVTARYLLPILTELGHLPVRSITPQMVKDLGKKLYPNKSSDSWRRWVIVPTRSVINRANALKPDVCPPIRIAGYDTSERIQQDRERGKKSRPVKTPGSWDWLLKFREHASNRHATLALLMFSTGARIGQAVAMTPKHLEHLDECKVTIPGAKGHEDRTISIPPELAEELKALPPKAPRGWANTKRNLRVFGWASKDGPRKGWMTACKKASIPYLPPHSAGRHGFGQEMHVRRKIDKKAVEKVGGWSPEGDMVGRTYTHAEESDAKIVKALRTGRVQAEKRTGLKLRKKVEK